MGVQVQSIDELNVNDVQQTLVTLQQLAQELNPTIDLRRGVLHDLLLYPAAIFSQINQENIDRLRRSMSLLAIEEDPTIADTDIVDQLLSNYRITRQEGQLARGTIKIVVDTLATATIASSAVFTANNLQFQTENSYVARTSALNIQSDTDRVLTPMPDGNYSFDIDVVALVEGSASMLKKDTLLIPSDTIINFVKAYTVSDFTDGTDAETNAQLILRMQEGISAKVASNRINMNALARNDDTLTSFVSSSIIGYGDPEMLRDKHSIIPIAYGGRVDWYLRTAEQPITTTLTKEATLIQKTTDGFGIWQFALTRNEVPGFYDILSIVPEGSANNVGSYAITSEIRGYDLTAIPGELVPDIINNDEAAFSRYQTAVIRFKDDDVPTGSLVVDTAKRDYSVAIRVMPNIAYAQTLISNRENRYCAGDTLVKAPIPCFVRISFTINKWTNDVTPDVEAIKSDIAYYVNRLGFTGRLHGSSICDIAHNRLTGKMALSSLDLFGQIRRPNQTILPIRNSEVLIIPSEPANMVSARTVAFILDTNSITISVNTTDMPDI